MFRVQNKIMESCFLCFLRLLTCTCTNHICCSICLWAAVMILVLTVVALATTISVYTVGGVLLLLGTCGFYSSSFILQWFREYPYKRVYLCFSRNFLQSARYLHQCARQGGIRCGVYYDVIRSWAPFCCCRHRTAVHPSVVIVESCDNTIALGVVIGHPKHEIV